MTDGFIRSELCGLRTPDGGPLWDGNADVAVQPACTDEQAIWERNLAGDLAQGVHESREDAVRGNGFAFLVEHLEPDE